MKIRADMSKNAALRIDELPWVPSPTAGVDRRMLDRVGDEVARATSVVRYARGSSFPTHEHGAGEEFLVLEGVFEDEHGAYPAGTYVRNPWGTSHAPASSGGCVIFVKLRQMVAEDQAQVVLRPDEVHFQLSDRPGVELAQLHAHGSEIVELQRWAPGASVESIYPGGAELLVLDGELEDEGGRHPALSWLRLSPGTRHRATSPSGCRLWMKRGHLDLEPG